MFPLEQEIIDKYRRFWCNLALKHSTSWHTIVGFEQDDWWHRDLASAVKLPIITKAIWDETVARAYLIEAKTTYTIACRKFTEELDDQEINYFELGHELRIRN